MTTLTIDDANRHAGVVSRLQKSEIFRDYQRAFQTATGLPLVLRAVGSFQPPLRGSKQVNAFCALLRVNFASAQHRQRQPVTTFD